VRIVAVRPGWGRALHHDTLVKGADLQDGARTVRFDARGFPAADREEAVRATVSRTLAPLEIGYVADRGPAAASLAITDLTELTVWSVNSTAVKVHYKALPRDDVKPSLFLGLQIMGSCVVVQRDREITLRPGDLAVSQVRSHASTGPAALFADQVQESQDGGYCRCTL
jgi:hypothetical protein